jgi:16S rRNA (uracil1498-N3)-methyltransferase
VDGVGGFYNGIIEEDTPKRCSITIKDTKTDYGKRDYYLHVAIAPTKNIDRFEWFLEKATEIGIDEITPLICEHSERRKVNMDRLQKVLLAAMKQSLKAYLPKLNDVMDFSKTVNTLHGDLKLICKAGSEVHLKSQYNSGKNVVILIGPEGDFSEEEINMAGRSNFTPVHLGPDRLRTETAGVVATTIINLINQK